MRRRNTHNIGGRRRRRHPANLSLSPLLNPNCTHCELYRVRFSRDRIFLFNSVEFNTKYLLFSTNHRHHCVYIQHSAVAANNNAPPSLPPAPHPPPPIRPHIAKSHKWKLTLMEEARTAKNGDERFTSNVRTSESISICETHKKCYEKVYAELLQPIRCRPSVCPSANEMASIHTKQ